MRAGSRYNRRRKPDLRPCPGPTQRREVVHQSWLPGLLCLGLLAGCAAETEQRGDGDRIGQTFPIINGQPPNAAHHNAVVALHRVNGSSVDPDSFCSGTLISPTVVITAAHCLVVSGTVSIPPSTLAIYFGNAPLSDPNPDFRAVSETEIHPSYNRSARRNDMGLIRLAAPQNDVTPVPTLPASLGFSNSDVGQTVLNFAGFGRASNGSFDVKLQVNGTLGGLGCSVSGCSGTPNDLERATQISYRQPSGGPCSGDSGGPAFVSRGGTMYVGGMTSWGDFACTQFGVSTRADAYEDYIQDFIGVPPTPDPGPGDPPPGGSTQTYQEADLAGSKDQDLAFSFNIPAGSSDLTIAIFGGSGDADLYTRFGQAPTTGTYDCRPYLNGNNESCSVPNPQAGTYHVMLRGWAPFSGVTLMVEYQGTPSEPGPDPAPPGASDFPIDVVVGSIPKDQEARGDFDVPAGYSRLVFSISGGTGDADLYVRRNSAPTTTAYDCRPYLNGNNEECAVDNPAAGTYHVMVRGWSNSTNVRFRGTLE